MRVVIRGHYTDSRGYPEMNASQQSRRLCFPQVMPPGPTAEKWVYCPRNIRVPIPPVIEWDAIGDGRIFNQWANSGDPPEVVWRDHDYVRDQFRLAIDYSLQTIGAWAARHSDDDPPLIVMLGDHEPARFVSGVDGFDVPLHVIGPPALVDHFAPLGWTEGMLPDPDQPLLRMDALRDLLLRSLSTGQ